MVYDFQRQKAFFSFSVNDLEEAKKFYGQTLRLDVSESKEGLNLQIKGGNDVFIYPKPPITFLRLRLLPYLIL